jgi:hypothetical protein
MHDRPPSQAAGFLSLLINPVAIPLFNEAAGPL